MPLICTACSQPIDPARPYVTSPLAHVACAGVPVDRNPEGNRKRRGKFNAQRTELDGIVFDSKKEAGRYLELREQERRGAITGLELQPKYTITVGEVKVCTYTADFRYTTDTGDVVVEDAKGFRTRDYKLKKRLMLAVHGITILET